MASRRLIRSLFLLILAFAGPSWAAGAPARMQAFSTLDLNEEVHGDVFILAGDVNLGPQARVHGDVVALLGNVQVEDGAEVSGRVIAVRSIASMSLHPGTQPGLSHLEAAVRVLSSGGWLFVATAIASLFPRKIRVGSAAVVELPLHTMILGVMILVTLLVALVAVLGFNPGISIPVAAAIWMVFFALKAVGLTAIGMVLGQSLLRVVSRRNLPLTWPVFLGVAVMLLLRLLPWVGGALWTLMSFASLGAGILAIAVNRESGTGELA